MDVSFKVRFFFHIYRKRKKRRAADELYLPMIAVNEK